MTKAADDYESIARHLKELEAERQLALTGSSAPVTERQVWETHTLTIAELPSHAWPMHSVEDVYG